MHIKPSMTSPCSSRHAATKASRLGGKHARLLRLLSGVDLHQQSRALAGALELRGKRGGKLRPVEALDHVEQFDGVANLVRLQRADQMQLEIRMTRLKRRVFRLRFLHAVLAEAALTELDRLLDDVLGYGLGDGDKLDRASSRPDARAAAAISRNTTRSDDETDLVCSCHRHGRAGARRNSSASVDAGLVEGLGDVGLDGLGRGDVVGAARIALLQLGGAAPDTARWRVWRRAARPHRNRRWPCRSGPA